MSIWPAPAAMERGDEFYVRPEGGYERRSVCRGAEMQANYSGITWTMSRFLFMEYRSTGWLNLMSIT